MTPTKDQEDWLSKVEAGYIGVQKPQVVHVPNPFEAVPYHIMRRAEKLHYQLGIPYEQMNLDDQDKINGIDDGEGPRERGE